MGSNHSVEQKSSGLENLEVLAKHIAQPDKNKNPIVLVSGFSGWGEPLFGTFNYWGGFEDLPTALHKAVGVPIILPRIGPLSSNWERACEVYCQLSNLRGSSNGEHAGGFDTAGSTSIKISVEYGTYIPHLQQPPPSAPFETKQAVLIGDLSPGWKWDATHPVHMICHSQGGNTARLLIELLSGRQEHLHPTYFNEPGRQNWIKGVVTLGTPHQGTTIIDAIEKLLPPDPDDVLDLITRLVASTSFSDTARVYDLQLDHWGFSRKENQSFRAMHLEITERVKEWWESEYNGFKDNSVDGVAKLNALAAEPCDEIYFFTVSFDATNPLPRLNLSADDLKRFPVHPLIAMNGVGFPGPFDIGAHIGPSIGTLIHGISDLIPGHPGDLAYAKYLVEIVNSHARDLGYFSRIPVPGKRIPRPDMLPVLSLFSYAMSGLDGSSVPFQPAELNDGVVNTKSMLGPNSSQIQEISNFDDIAGFDIKETKGCYLHLGTNHTMDHADQIGVFTVEEIYEDVEKMYGFLGKLLLSLE